MLYDVVKDGKVLGTFDNYRKAVEAKREAIDTPTSTQQSIEITPELRQSVKEGMPLFKDKWKNLADNIRKGKIADDIAMSGVPFA
jgi:hypothetical protein